MDIPDWGLRRYVLNDESTVINKKRKFLLIKDNNIIANVRTI